AHGMTMIDVEARRTVPPSTETSTKIRVGPPYHGSGTSATYVACDDGATMLGPFTDVPATATVGWISVVPVLRTTTTVDADRGHHVELLWLVIDTISNDAVGAAGACAAAAVVPKNMMTAQSRPAPHAWASRCVTGARRPTPGGRRRTVSRAR